MGKNKKTKNFFTQFKKLKYFFHSMWMHQKKLKKHDVSENEQERKQEGREEVQPADAEQAEEGKGNEQHEPDCGR